MKKRTPPSMRVILASPNERKKKMLLEKRLERSFGEGQMHRLLGESLILRMTSVEKHENNERHPAWELIWSIIPCIRTRISKKTSTE